MSDPAQNEERIFADALLLPSSERADFLAKACEGNPALRKRIEDLLKAHDAAATFMTTPPGAASRAGVGETTAASEDRPGTRIGRYKLLQLLGEGGCGVVWMAEQEEPVRRRVALKVIKLGMDTKMVIARFEAERQALALMDHPNIARVLDAGATESGRPFFVMELVAGVPITKYCDQHQLPTETRLRLFAQVCHAVQHAHQKGIIHRDLKPSNVLVTLHDGEPTPKVIDFGIAKATQGKLTDQTLFTAFEQFIGTPAYMSPEQAEMSGVDVDTRTDIYSLGVLLYELLTGQPPFDPKSLVQAGLDEIRRIIREVEPPKPSTKLNTLGDIDRSTTAQRRGTAPAQLSLLLRGDLDWIVMKALDKNPNRRYETANGFALDIERHLHDEPVSARPPSTGYRVSRFVRRNRLAVMCGSMVALALIVGTVVSTLEARRARRAEQLAEQQRARAIQERGRAEDLLGFMLGDLRSQLAKVGRVDVLDAVGDKAMAYFSSRRAEGLDDAALTRYAKALTQIGEIRMDQTRYPDALAAFTEANTLTTTLVNRHSGDGAMLFERGQSEYWIGFVHWKRGQLNDAATWLQRYHDTSAALVALDPARLEWQSELAYGEHNLAVLEKDRGDFDRARSDFYAEIATLERLAQVAASKSDFKFRIADAHSWLGGLAVQSGELATALREYDSQRTYLEALAAAEPRTAQWRFSLANAELFCVEMQLATAKIEAAQQQLRVARRRLDELISHDPGNRQWKITSLRARLLELELRLHARSPTDVTEQIETVRHEIEELATAEPMDRRLTRWNIWALRLEARAIEMSGRDGGTAAAAAVRVGESLIQQGRATDSDISEYALACVLLGEVEAKHDRVADAEIHWKNAMDVLDKYVSQSREYELLDAAVRAAVRLHRDDVARSLVARLNEIGYVPLEPFPR